MPTEAEWRKILKQPAFLGCGGCVVLKMLEAEKAFAIIKKGNKHLTKPYADGRRDMLEKVDVKCGELSRVDFTDWVDDQLAKEAGDE